jgi:hypothetical protein
MFQETAVSVALQLDPAVTILTAPVALLTQA